MDKKMEKAMNEQITKELYSSYLYLGMVAYFEAENLGGFAQWMKIQAAEEISHAMKFFNYINERGGTVILEAIDKPPAKYVSPEDVFKKTLEHEKFVTASINDLYTLAKEINDNASLIFLEWFVTEQVEEEKNPSDILGKLKYVVNQPAGILMMDKELGARALPVFQPNGEIAGG
ncbi:MAG: ferritin [Candidatus Aceula meridiana]|nr:ferritin [Candidatus Aceula meridiana]